APIGIEGSILFVSRNVHQRLQHGSQFLLSDSLDEILKRLASLALSHEAIRDQFHHLRDLLRRHGSHRQAIRTGVILPLAAQHNLEMRNLAIADRPAGSIKTKIRDVVLSARIETTADFDVEIFDSLVEVEKPSSQPCSDFSGQAARRSNAQLTGV